MLLPFKMGLGGVIGSGDQYYSWISLADLCEAFLYLASSSSSEGVYNLTAPGSCSNLDFTRALLALHLALFPMPAFAARLAFGEMADALLLSGQHVWPGRLQQEHFEFKAATLQRAFEQVL